MAKYQWNKQQRINDFQVFNEGTITRVTGKPGAGKTFGAMWFIERCWNRLRKARKRWPYKILTNVIIDWDRDPAHPMRKDIIQVTSLTTLYWEILESKEAVLVLDEAGLFGSSGAAGRRKDLGQWEQIIKLCRKLGMAIIWIDQRGKGSIPPTVRDLCTWHIHKPGKGYILLKEVEYRDDGKEPVERIRGKYRSWGGLTIPYEGKAPGSFDMFLGEKAVIVGKKEKWVPITTHDVYDAIKSCKEREIRPTLRKFLEFYSIFPDKMDRRANNTDRENTVGTGMIRDRRRPGSSPVTPGIIDSDKAAVYAIVDRHRSVGLTELPLPREIQAALPWMYASTVSRYLNEYCRDKGLPPPSRSGGKGIKAKSFRERVKETRARIKKNKSKEKEHEILEDNVKNFSPDQTDIGEEDIETWNEIPVGPQSHRIRT